MWNVVIHPRFELGIEKSSKFLAKQGIPGKNKEK